MNRSSVVQALAKHPDSSIVPAVSEEEQARMRIMKLVGNGECLFSRSPVKLDAQIRELEKITQGPTGVEANLRKKRMQHTKKMKRELEDKLGHINDALDEVYSDEELEEGPARPKLMDSSARKQHFEELKQKEAEAKKYAAKLRKEQRELEARRKQRQREMEDFIEYEKKEKEFAASEREERMAEAREKRLQDLADKAELRREEMEDRFDLPPHQIYEKPLYVELQENFAQNILVPELTAKKAALKQIREGMSVGSISEIQEHARKYSRKLRESENRRQRENKNFKTETRLQAASNTHYQSDYYSQYREAKSVPSDRYKIDEEKKRAARERQLKYAEVVKETHVPEISRQKQLEMQKIKEKLVHPSRPKVFNPDQAEELKQRRLEEQKQRLREEQKRRREAHHSSQPPATVPARTVASPPTKIEDKSVDFLAIRRQQREKNASEGRYARLNAKIETDDLAHLSTNERVSKIRNTTSKLEKEIELKERFIRQSAPISMEKIAAEGDVDDALLNSIKAKLKLFDQV